MNALLLQAAALTVLVTVAAHSYFGEKRLIAPILALDAPLVQRPLARAVLRFAWHFSSVLGLVIAVLLWRSAVHPEFADPVVLIATGAGLLVSGLVDAVWSRFRHIGWPMLTLAGALILLSLARA